MARASYVQPFGPMIFSLSRLNLWGVNLGEFDNYTQRYEMKSYEALYIHENKHLGRNHK